MNRRLFLALALLSACAFRTRPPLPLPMKPLSPTEDAPFRAERPLPMAEHPLAIQTPEVFTLSNGLTVALVQRPQSRMITVTLVSNRAGDDGLVQRSGLAIMANQLLTRGTGDAATANLNLRSYFSRDGAGFTTRATIIDLPQVLSEMTTLVSQLPFGQPVFDRVKGDYLNALTETKLDQSKIAFRLAQRQLHGEEHPLGTSPGGQE